MNFWESSFLWYEAVLASVVLAALCGIIGIFTILRRVVFLPAALSQISGLAVMIAFTLPLLLPALKGNIFVHPELIALLITLMTALVLGWTKEPRRISREAIIGIIYITASALMIIIGDRIPQESHKVDEILFGNAVMVDRAHMILALSVSIGIGILYLIMLRPFLFSSFDPETAIAHRLRVRSIDAALFLSIGASVTIATKTIGAMPVFAFTVLPGATALILFHEIHRVFLCAGLSAAFAAFLGYWASFVWELPTGACTVTVTAVFLLVSMLYKFVLNRFVR